MSVLSLEWCSPTKCQAQIKVKSKSGIKHNKNRGTVFSRDWKTKRQL